MHLLCTFAVLPAARKIFSTSVAVHILCAASKQHRRYHGIQFRWSLLLCTSSVLPARQALQKFFLNMQPVPAVHILCAASTHHRRIRSMLLSLYVECIRCAHSLCCQQAASRMPPREQHQKYKLSLPKSVALILQKQLFERIWLQMLSQSQDHHTTVTL